MTKDKWLTTADTYAMLHFVGKKGDERAYRLLAVRCCEHVVNLIPPKIPLAKCLAVAKRFSCGLASLRELAVAAAVAHRLRTTTKNGASRLAQATCAACWIPHPNNHPWRKSSQSLDEILFALEETENTEAALTERKWQADLIRHTFNPFALGG